jgi:hypothetical protein
MVLSGKITYAGVEDFKKHTFFILKLLVAPSHKRLLTGNSYYFMLEAGFLSREASNE